MKKINTECKQWNWNVFKPFNRTEPLEWAPWMNPLNELLECNLSKFQMGILLRDGRFLAPARVQSMETILKFLLHEARARSTEGLRVWRPGD